MSDLERIDLERIDLERIDLAVTASILRAGLHGEAVPSYDAALVGRVVARAARKAAVARGRA